MTIFTIILIYYLCLIALAGVVLALVVLGVRDWLAQRKRAKLTATHPFLWQPNRPNIRKETP